MNIAHPIKPLTIGRVTATGLLALGLIANGCKSAPPPPPAAAPATPPATATNAPQQGTLNPDGTFTPNPNPQPAANVPPPPPPAMTPAPAPATATAPPPPPAPVYRTVPAGARVAVTVTQTLSASHNEVGDSFSGVLAEPLTATGGKTVFARGTAVRGTVVAAKGKGRFKGAGALGIELTTIAGERVSTSEYEQESKGRGKRSAGFIGGGAGLGAIIGGIAGGGKGALIGGLAGGGGGTAAAAYTGNRDVVIPSESTVTFRLNTPLRVQ
ncbi:hypothetical protein [Granulicella sibirica]|uniref:Uncharacterized protein n=1 Tax=Granulicella sibirica TaxID=2479048 RepID=A0A4Q0SZG6_9BACT|nr:hypothetical protein [Granulicella sibirica]RXH55822.1 hypothetical protein GRAN_2679 [Granulicella sibirica]